MARGRDLAQEAAGRQERGGEVGGERLLPPVERQLPGGTSSSGQTPATAAQTSRPPSSPRTSAKRRSASSSYRRSAWRSTEPSQSAATASARSRPWWKCTPTREPSAANARAQAAPIRRTPRSRARACLPARLHRRRCFHLGRENSTGSCRRRLEASQRERRGSAHGNRARIPRVEPWRGCGRAPPLETLALVDAGIRTEEERKRPD